MQLAICNIVFLMIFKTEKFQLLHNHAFNFWNWMCWINFKNLVQLRDIGLQLLVSKLISKNKQKINQKIQKYSSKKGFKKEETKTWNFSSKNFFGKKPSHKFCSFDAAKKIVQRFFLSNFHSFFSQCFSSFVFWLLNI